MLGFLYRFFVGSFKVEEPHRCEWEILEKFGVYNPGGIKAGKAPYAFKYVLRCKHCGDIKNKEI